MKNHPKKAIPQAGTDQTLGPNMDYIYFEHNKTYPFSPRKNDYSPVNAWWLSEASFLAYCHPGFVRMAFYIAGYTEFRFFNGPGTECMVASSKKATIVVFRGTEINSLSFFHELNTNLNTRLAPFPEGGNVHRGFLKGLEEIWMPKGKQYVKNNPTHHSGLHPYLQKLLKDNPRRPMWLCGHSLGGALATLCFARIPQARGLYIYGAPRIGDAGFNALLTGRQVFRIEHAADPIPLVPPQIPSINLNFQDTGKLVYINKKGEKSDDRPRLESLRSLERETAVVEAEKKSGNEITKNWAKLPEDKKTLDSNIKQIETHVKKSFSNWVGHFGKMFDNFVPNIEDHMPVYYSVKLWNLIE